MRKKGKVVRVRVYGNWGVGNEEGLEGELESMEVGEYGSWGV